MNVVISALLTAVAFGLLAFLGAQLGGMACANVAPLPGGPARGVPPVRWLVAGCAVLGAVLALQGGDLSLIALTGILCVSLVGAWCADVTCGIVPDAFTIFPLCAVLIAGLLQHEWWHALAALIMLAPFAVAAVVSNGRGMGWGDVKLAALGGAVLGAGVALAAFAAACLVAVGVAWASKRRGEPIVFAPYMVASIFAALLAGARP
jgi:prepilin signal peptidase PulO-like enzyme (type II secretory pathway)